MKRKRKPTIKPGVVAGIKRGNQPLRVIEAIHAHDLSQHCLDRSAMVAETFGVEVMVGNLFAWDPSLKTFDTFFNFHAWAIDTDGTIIETGQRSILTGLNEHGFEKREHIFDATARLVAPEPVEGGLRIPFPRSEDRPDLVYVPCVISPPDHPGWVMSGGFDKFRHIIGKVLDAGGSMPPKRIVRMLERSVAR